MGGHHSSHPLSAYGKDSYPRDLKKSPLLIQKMDPIGPGWTEISRPHRLRKNHVGQESFHHLGGYGLRGEPGNNENVTQVFFPNSPESLERICFTVTVQIPPSNSQRKTAKYLSSFEICKIIGIDHKTYRRHEGGLFPVAQRNPTNGFRIFTKQEANQLRKLWDNRAEYFSRNRHYRYHKTRNFYSLAEACKQIGISQKTFRQHEGSLFPVIWRDNKAGRRLFTEKDIEQHFLFHRYETPRSVG